MCLQAVLIYYLVFHLVYGTDKPLWLDGYLLLVDKVVFHIKAQFEYTSLYYIYWYYFTVYFLA